MQNRDKLAIFDFDGTLFDTRMVNYHSYNEALKEYNYSIDFEYYCNYCDGLDYKTFLPNIIGSNQEMINAVHKIKKEKYSEYIGHAKINKPLFDIAEAIKIHYWVAIVTTASRKNCLELLHSFDKDNFFDIILAQEDIPRKKPDPQGFLMAMEHFSVKPENTFIFEDSKTGIEAAKKTGVAVFKVERFL